MALEKMGELFPEFERFETGMVEIREPGHMAIRVSLLPRLKFFHVSGYSTVVSENDVSGHFLNLIVHAPGIEEFSFNNSYIPGRRYDLFKAGKVL